MKVQAITGVKDIKSIKKLLTDVPRDRLLFILGVNSGLRVQDLLTLKVSDLDGRKVGDRIAIRKLKTGKDNVLVVNQEILAAFKDYTVTTAPEAGHYLFRSRKGRNYPLTTYAVTGMVKR